MSLKMISGDLIKAAKEGNFDVIAHGCNCFCNFGAGIALQIRYVFPEAYAADCQTEKGDINKLGTCSVADITLENNQVLHIVNAYTQFSTGRGLQVNYDSVRFCMRYIKKRFSGLRIGLPLIGCGLAGGDWDVVGPIIAEELSDEDVTIMVL